MNTWIARKDLMKNHHQIKKIFLQQIKLEDITDKDYAHPQQVFAELKLKTLGDYHDLHVQHDTLLLADAFENLETSVLKYMNSILLIFCLLLDYHNRLV